MIVKVTAHFKAEAKPLIKKYPSLLDDIERLIESLVLNPIQGVPLGKNCYKIRIAIKSKGKGKSGGARIITCFKILDSTVYLVSIYDKSNKDSISTGELKQWLKDI